MAAPSYGGPSPFYDTGTTVNGNSDCCSFLTGGYVGWVLTQQQL